MLPTRDGISLATDIYFPALTGARLPGKFPAILEGICPLMHFYPIARFDGDGKLLYARAVTQFTSQMQTFHQFIRRGSGPLRCTTVANPINRYSLSSRDKFQQNQDDSVDLYIQKESPGADKQSNWLPAPDGEFILMTYTGRGMKL